MSTSDWLALSSLVVAGAALVISIYAIVRANKTTSAATFLALSEGFRQAWDRYLDEDDPAMKRYNLADLLNLLELACGIYLEKSVSGNSRKLAVAYLNNVLLILINNSQVNVEITSLLQNKDTFIFIRKFLKKKRSKLSVTVPIKWYELQS